MTWRRRYEFAGIDPNKSLAKKSVLPMIGVSFKRYLTGEVQERRAATTGLNCIIRRPRVDGEWKLRRLVPRGLTAGDAPWQLFNLHDDPLETHDVAAEHPDRVKAMSEAYEAFAKRTMVTKAQGKMIDYVGIDSKTGRYLAVDPATMKPVPAPQAIPVSEIH